MKKLMTVIAAVAFAAFSFTACGGGDPEAEKMLDELEAIVNRLDSLKAASQGGDLNAAQQLVSDGNRMMEISQEIVNKEDDLSFSQRSRFIELSEKVSGE